MGNRFLISNAGLASKKIRNLLFGFSSRFDSKVWSPIYLSSCKSCSFSAARSLQSDADAGSAHKLFDGMPSRSEQAKSTHFNRVLHLLRSPILVSRITLMNYHCLALKIGALAHLPISTYLLVAYSRTGAMTSSQAMFDEIPEPDVISRNAMMTALVEHYFFDKAIALFLKMVGSFGFNSTSLLIIVSGLSSVHDLIQGRLLHGLGFKSGFSSDCSFCNSLIDMYAKCGDLQSSEHMFADIDFRDRDTFSWNSVISGCLHSNDFFSCLQYFKERTGFGLKGDTISLSCAISAASMIDFEFGRSLHGFAAKIGLDNSLNNTVANSLVSFYFDYGDATSAESIFREMRHQDVVSWNSMIRGYTKNGRFMKVFDLVHGLQLKLPIRMDEVTFLAIASACTDGSFFEEGRSVHGLILRLGMESDSSLMNSLIDFYGKCSRIKKAELLFNSMAEKDLISWNSMIASYTQNGQSLAAQKLFKQLLRRSVFCSVATPLAVLPSCNSAESLRFGKSIHTWQFKSGFSCNLVINSLMSMYINCGDLRTAFLILQTDSDLTDVTSWNTIITGSVKNGFFQEALEAFQLMTSKFDSITLLGVLSACGNLGLFNGGELVHGLAVKTLSESDTHLQNALIVMYGRFGDLQSAIFVFRSSPNLNLCSWNCLISAFCQNNNPFEALNLFRHLTLDPDEFTVSAAVSACTQLGAILHGKQIHGFSIRRGLHRNSVICSSIQDWYSNCGRLDLALLVFSSLDKKSITAWNSMISAVGYHSDGHKSIELFKQMCRNGIEPNNGTFTSLLSACSHSGLVQQGLFYYNIMEQDFGVEPVTEHSVCVVDMLGRSGQLVEAYDFVRNLKNEAESGVWGALLSSCCYHGDIELGRQVAEHLFTLDPGNPGYYVALSNMYVTAGRWSEAIQLRELIEDKGLRKPPGYSLIDVRFA